LNDLAHVEQSLMEARDALLEFWEQGEGAVCFLALGVADDALADYRVLDGRMARGRDPSDWRRIDILAEEVMRLRAPLEGTTKEAWPSDRSEQWAAHVGHTDCSVRDGEVP